MVALGGVYDGTSDFSVPSGWESRGRQFLSLLLPTALQMRHLNAFLTDDNSKANSIKRLATPSWSQT